MGENVTSSAASHRVLHGCVIGHQVEEEAFLVAVGDQAPVVHQSFGAPDLDDHVGAIEAPEWIVVSGVSEFLQVDECGTYAAKRSRGRPEHSLSNAFLDKARSVSGADRLADGARKPFRTTFSASDYAAVRALGSEFLKRKPRSVAK